MSAPKASSTKAVLLSALVCPGAGQLYLRRYVMATLLLVVTVIALVMVLVPTVTAAHALAEQILNGELQGNANLLSAISSTATEVTASSGPATLALLVSWIIGVVHAWYFGRQQSR